MNVRNLEGIKKILELKVKLMIQIIVCFLPAFCISIPEIEGID